VQIPGWIDHDLGVIFFVRVETTEHPHAECITRGNGGLKLAQDLHVIADGFSRLQRKPFHAFDHVQALQHRNGGRRGLEATSSAGIEEAIGLAARTNSHKGHERCKFAVLVIHCIRLLADFGR
jgi:hypothetical protein